MYPVGIKICATWFEAKELGIAVGFLVGALVLGTGAAHTLSFVLNYSSQGYHSFLAPSIAFQAGKRLLAQYLPSQSLVA